MKKKILVAMIAAATGLALLAPKTAHATTTSDLQDIIDKAYSLCTLDTKVYANSCTRAEELNVIKEQAAKKPADAQAAYIASKVPNFADIKYGVNRSYYIAVTNKQINADGSAATGADPSTSDSCGSSDVGVSVDVGCSGTGNPIYDYLRSIITWMGGLIGLAIVITLIVSGIQYSASSGEPANIAKAKDRIVNAVIGLILYIMLAAILRYLIPGIFT